ncbi:MAG: hypothetical protein ABIH83_00085, partial [Candidatus Micrarchaeota archaeon]
ALIIQNTEAEQLKLTNVSMGGTGFTASKLPNQYFSAGEKHNQTLVFTGSTCDSGNTYELYVNFTYDNSDGTIQDQMEYGAKTLVGKCS